MKIAAYPAMACISIGLFIANLFGYERCIEVSDHSIEIGLEKPNKTTRAWDSNLYKRGNLFLAGYANPIKPRADYDTSLENPDTIEHVEGEPYDDTDAETDTDGAHVQLISSSRYREYMRQDLISQLLTPQEQWKLIAYIVGALGVLMLINVVISLAAAGAF